MRPVIGKTSAKRAVIFQFQRNETAKRLRCNLLDTRLTSSFIKHRHSEFLSSFVVYLLAKRIVHRYFYFVVRAHAHVETRTRSSLLCKRVRYRVLASVHAFIDV